MAQKKNATKAKPKEAKPKVVKKVKHQTGVDKQTPRGRAMDAQLSALPPGKRVSKSGNVYWETRVNRSDLYGNGGRSKSDEFVPLYLVEEPKKKKNSTTKKTATKGKSPTAKKSSTKKGSTTKNNAKKGSTEKKTTTTKAEPKTTKKSTTKKSSEKWYFPW